MIHDISDEWVTHNLQLTMSDIDKELGLDIVRKLQDEKVFDDNDSDDDDHGNRQC
jgi:hypothetical protein